MALVLEDGVADDANSYADRTIADAYFDLRPSGNATWDALSDDEKDDNLIAATQYIELRFGQRFKGTRESQGQPLSFPRQGFFDQRGDLIEGIPLELEQATAEYALQNSTTVLIEPPAASASEGEVTEQEDKVGPITTRTRFSRSGGTSGGSGLVSGKNIKEYPIPDLLIEPLLRPTGQTVRR